MSNQKLTSEELSDVMIDSLVLSNMLVEKFEIMEENKLVAHKAKQSVKNAAMHLSNYINKVFSNNDKDEEEHFRTGTNIILIKQLKVEKVLADKEILIIGDRKKILIDILNKFHINQEVIKQIISEVNDSEILKI